MSKYLLNNKSSLPNLAVDDVLYYCNISNGGSKNYVFPKGKYKLECWGASWMRSYGYGYSKGVLELKEDTKLWLYLGGIGSDYTTESNTYLEGGFNGGGDAHYTTYGNGYSETSSGCGATDIRIGQDSLYSRVIVAGGASGAAYVYDSEGNVLDCNDGWYGGGLNG